MTSLCLYLPNVSPDYKYRDIKNIFTKYKFGTINYINIVKTEFPYNRVFIDFNIWFNTQRNDMLKKNLIDGASFKIFHDKYDFWNCYLAKSKPKSNSFDRVL